MGVQQGDVSDITSRTQPERVMSKQPKTAHSAHSTASCLTFRPASPATEYRTKYNYDDADQLTNITVAGQWKSDFAYDGFGRRRIVREYNWAFGNWSLTSET